MQGVWYNRCPLCGNYMMKQDPMTALACCVCGWNEERTVFFCKTTCTYCHLTPRGLEAEQLSVSEPRRDMLKREKE